MYLKEIVATGFKSFADKLAISLDDKITCIVGPNGSGKSNVVDAVRWVLGEQSVKTLRGDGTMSDVIFSGSKSRNPLNVASVSLVFDNNDHYLKVPYTEVSIKRRAYRSGENEYFLNGEKCRLKDITDLFLDSGIGKESFNIISQGEVQRILSNSATERRLIFEEAAGVLKYKKRKEEALRKLDRTHNNLDRINDIIAELELQVEPLKEQSAKAKEYLENKNGVEKYEVALLAYDIHDMMEDYHQKKDKIASLEQEVLLLSNQYTNQDVKITESKNQLSKIEKELDEANQNLVQILQEVEKLNSERVLLKERSKYDGNSDQIHQNLLTLKEEEEQKKSALAVLEDEIRRKQETLALLQQEDREQVEQIQDQKQKQSLLEKEYAYKDKELLQLEHKIDLLRQEIENGGGLPNSVKSILSNPKLTGIHNALGNLLTVDLRYQKAIEVAIASSKFFIVTEHEEDAKRAISYLKQHQLGRATFFPLDVIKPKAIDPDTMEILEQDPSFIGVFSDLVSFDATYRNIILNQLGNVIVADNLDGANNLGRKIHHRYKIITLDADVVHVGGSMTGGSSSYVGKSIISQKQDLEHLMNQARLNKEAMESLTEEIEEIKTKIAKLENLRYEQKPQQIEQEELLRAKMEQNGQLKEQLLAIENERTSLGHLVDSTLLEEEEKILGKYYEKVSEKEKTMAQIKQLAGEEERMKRSIEEKEADDRLQNALLRKKEAELKELEIEASKLDIKLDQMLNTLSSEYELTFEKAQQNYSLDIEVEEARSKLKIYKENIKRLGMVNLSAIEEYERVSTRYDFLMNQRQDLLEAQDTLLEIMDEMDEVMKEEFLKTFTQIEQEFKQVFKELFHGGSATLKLTQPENLLETGIEIIASPPGKKLTTISLLSGGEKTLTAISLLFAILNVRTVPFCLFDEVEAALDEANVDQFGKYLDHYKDKTQFLIITHKKKTMEYADTLYGITMQESGVSKLVSVRLNDKTKEEA